jgi:uncharacterized protein with PIN domain
MKLETSRGHTAVSQQYFPRCERCNGVLVAPEWSEPVNARCVRHLWSCDDCGYRFESWVYAAKDERV